MLLFISYLAYVRRLTYNGIKPYIHGVQNWALDRGFKDPTRHNGKKWHRFQKLVAGIKRATCGQKRVRKPLKLSMVKKIVSQRSSLSWAERDKLSFVSALLMAFFGFLRSSEYTMTSKNRDSFLRRRDAKIVTSKGRDRYIKLRLRKSKTDQFKESCIKIYGNEKALCPVKALKEYLDVVKRDKNSALFWFRNKPLSQKKFNEMLKYALKLVDINPKVFSSHSLRSGAASTAAHRGVPAWLIQKLGRWRSGCFKTYIPDPTTAIRKAQRSMAR